VHASKERFGIHSVLPIGRQVFILLQENRASSCIMVTCKDNAITLKVPPLLLLPPDLYAEHEIIWHGISLWAAVVGCSSCVFSQLLLHHQPIRWGDGMRRRKGLDSCVTTAQQ